jgi:hypothetical protein
VQMKHRDDRSGCGQSKLNVKLRKNEQDGTPKAMGCGSIVRANP